jgi:hypothetical protein
MLVRHAERDLVFRDRRALAGGVAGRDRVQRLAAALVILVGLEGENDKRPLAFRIMKNDDLLGWRAPSSKLPAGRTAAGRVGVGERLEIA